MFCDLADSTSLSGWLDPEDLGELIRAYQQAACAVIQRFDGHVAAVPWRCGLLVYFGYPSAHEDDAYRAVRAGLGILAGLDELNVILDRRHGVHVALRVGIHTGVVVVGDVGGGPRCGGGPLRSSSTEFPACGLSPSSMGTESRD
jgi:class 3 adenylate cyclase